MASYTISSKNEQYSYSNITGKNEDNYDTYKFIEGTTDTIKLVVTSGLLDYDKFYVTSTTANVITDVSTDMLSASNAYINNPIDNGILSIDLLGKNASLELFTIEGELMQEISVEGSAQIPVHHLASGMYLLRDSQSMSMRKIFIK